MRLFLCYEPDGEKSWARLLSGKTDIGVRLSPKDYHMLKQYHDRFCFNEVVSEYYSILLFNTTDPLFTEPDVRLALAYAVDKQALIDSIFHGAGMAATGPFGVNSPYHKPELKPVPYNPGRALELLKQAGWMYDSQDQFLHRQGKRFEFSILITEGHLIDKLVAECLQLFLNDVGIKTYLNSLAQNELLHRYDHNKEFQAVLTQLWASSKAPEIVVQVWAGVDGQKTGVGLFDHPQIAAVLHGIAQAKDSDKRKSLYQEVDSLVASLHPGVFLVHEVKFDVMSKRFRLPHRFSFDHSGTHRLWQASLGSR